MLRIPMTMNRFVTLAALLLFVAIAGCGKSEKQEGELVLHDEIAFSENELYPEGLAYDAEANVFFVTSLHYGTVGTVDWEGNYTTFIEYDDMPSTIGIELDADRNRLLVCVSDPGVSVHTVPDMQRKTAKLAIFDATTGERQHLINLGAMNEGFHFANDIALDPDGNAYVTDSFSPYIYKVTPEGVATVFATDARWEAEGFGLNGIDYHPDGFLIAAHAGQGTLYKLSMDSPPVIDVVGSDNNFVNADGIKFLDGTTLAVVQNTEMEISRVKSTDGWLTASKDRAVVSKYSFPTTMTIVGGELYILNAKLNEIFDPEIPLTSDFMIQKAKFE